MICADDRRAYWTALGWPCRRLAPDTGFYLVDDTHGLTLRNAAARDHGRGLRLDLGDAEIARRIASGRRSPLAQAIGLRRHREPRLLDTTCGLGRDSATLAALGARVTALERHPVLHALLDDALTRARAEPGGPQWLANWQTLVHADAIRWLEARPAAPAFDVIYIDPMFAAPRRKAAPQKALAWLNALVGIDIDADRLLAAACSRAGRQVVVKQHARAQPLALPDRQVRAKAVRFDIYLTGG
ncbi:class I SAM-dependent methyltransferase [Salinisphaera sp. T31B1]|uniref:class I SAM-dependent methyltransferase n=1 Tax=Salinisphaera sp. T31B1 TaxID=727963 RepID=UPI0033427B36